MGIDRKPSSSRLEHDLRRMWLLLVCRIDRLRSVCRGKETGCPAEVVKALESAEEFELLSLDPDFRNSDKSEKGFHEYKVLGKTKVKDKKDRKKLVEALKKGVKDSEGMVAACFNPRHGIRVKAEKDKTVDLVICFECLQIEVHNGAEKSSAPTTSDSEQGLQRGPQGGEDSDCGLSRRVETDSTVSNCHGGFMPRSASLSSSSLRSRLLGFGSPDLEIKPA